jgi:hypothetical protein
MGTETKNLNQLNDLLTPALSSKEREKRPALLLAG